MGGTRDEGVDAAALRTARPGVAPDGEGAPGAEPAWVDAHVHIFPQEMVQGRESYLPRDRRFAALYADPRARMATAEEVVAEMHRTGVAMSVVF